MSVIKNLILPVILALTGSYACAQNLYKGRIIDQLTRQPVEYALIGADSTGKSTVTNKYGDFKLWLAADSCTLKITCMGYHSQLIKAKGNTGPLVITLERGAIDLKEVLISPHMNNNTFHTISALDLSLRPVNSSQDLMRLVPGLFIAQHMGGGKAEQIFIRGFDADHGTDLEVSADGMPVNMVSHIHGQGYADLHFLVPETVDTYDFGKGPYYTGHGDFTTGGYLSYATKDALAKSVVSMEAGQFNTARIMGLIDLLGSKAKLKGENAYITGEYNYTDGPFTYAEHYKRFNLFGKYTAMLGANNKLSVSASAFSTSWRAAGEIPERAIAGGTIAIDDNGSPVTIPAAPVTVGRFGNIDSAQGGKSTRANAILKLTTDLKNNMTLENQVYYTHYTFLLHVNSTFFAEDSLNGDERQQQETRDMYGYNGKLTRQNYLGSAILTSSAGIGARADRTYGSQYTHVTERYQFLNTITAGDIKETNVNAYLDESLETGKWLFNIGSRIDHFSFNFHDTTNTRFILSPKINIQYTVNSALQLYLKLGKGFHSNNAIAATGSNAIEALPAAYGADLGANWKPAPHLYISAAVWYLYLQQEFVYTDDGSIAPGGKTHREGIDISGRYQLNKWLFADLNLNLARPRLADSLPGHGYLALAPAFTSTGGFDFKFANGINGGLSYRWMGKRPGNNMYTLAADGYYVTDLKINYTRRRYEIGLSIENLFNSKWNEFEAEELTRLRGESAPVDQMSFTPGTPFFAKLRVAVFF